MSDSITFRARKVKKAQRLCKHVLSTLADLLTDVGVYKYEKINGERRVTDGTTDNLVTASVRDEWESLAALWRGLNEELRYFVSRGMNISLPALPEPFAVGASADACADRLSPDPTIDKQRRFQEDREKFLGDVRALSRRLGSFQPSTDAVRRICRENLRRLRAFDDRCACGEEIVFLYDAEQTHYSSEPHPCPYTWNTALVVTEVEAQDLLDEIRGDVKLLTRGSEVSEKLDQGTAKSLRQLFTKHVNSSRPRDEKPTSPTIESQGEEQSPSEDSAEIMDKPPEKPRVSMLKPCEELAYSAYQEVTTRNPDLTTDRQVHEYLLANHNSAEDWVPPSKFDTFRRHLSMARRAHDDHKHTPRGGRPTGKSVVRENEL